MIPVHGYMCLFSLLPINRCPTVNQLLQHSSQSDGMTARLSILHAIIIMTELATLFDWQVIYGKCSAEAATRALLQRKKNTLIWLKNGWQNAIQSFIKEKLLTIHQALSLVAVAKPVNLSFLVNGLHGGRVTTQNSQKQFETMAFQYHTKGLFYVSSWLVLNLEFWKMS